MGADLTLEGFWQEMQKRGGQQRASGQAEHVLGVACQYAETQQSGQPDAAHTRQQRRCNDCHKSHKNAPREGQQRTEKTRRSPSLPAGQQFILSSVSGKAQPGAHAQATPWVLNQASARLKPSCAASAR